jgi:hypothetical protein
VEDQAADMYLPRLFSNSGVSRPSRGGPMMIERRRVMQQRAQYAQVYAPSRHPPAAETL